MILGDTTIHDQQIVPSLRLSFLFCFFHSLHGPLIVPGILTLSTQIGNPESRFKKRGLTPSPDAFTAIAKLVSVSCVICIPES